MFPLNEKKSTIRFIYNLKNEIKRMIPESDLLRTVFYFHSNIFHIQLLKAYQICLVILGPFPCIF